MKCRDKEIKNAVIINGILYEVVLANAQYCSDCDLPFHSECWVLCHYFDKENSYAVFKHLVGEQILKIHENETKG